MEIVATSNHVIIVLAVYFPCILQKDQFQVWKKKKTDPETKNWPFTSDSLRDEFHVMQLASRCWGLNSGDLSSGLSSQGLCCVSLKMLYLTSLTIIWPLVAAAGIWVIVLPLNDSKAHSRTWAEWSMSKRGQGIAGGVWTLRFGRLRQRYLCH